MNSISELELDFIREFINIGMGKAGQSLNIMLESPIDLSVANIEILSEDDISNIIESDSKAKLSIVEMGISGELTGTASLIFPKDSALKLEQALTGVELETKDLDTIREGALSEIGNIVINSIMGMMSNMLIIDLHYTITRYFEGSITDLYKSTITESTEKNVPIKINTHFNIRNLFIEGDIIIFFSLKAFVHLKQLIAVYLQDLLVEEIKQRKFLETKLRKSLKEKEVLIKEVHHRVKNNLMLISSLINLQIMQIKEEKTISILNDLMKRVDSIALIHEKLYKSDDLVSISSEEYISDLLENIEDSLVSDKRQIKFVTKIGDIKLDIETTIPLGLVVTEIVTNSLKYAFPDKKKGGIVVQLTEKQNMCKLTISDTGPGFPEDFDENKSDSLGWLIINTMTSQLKGEHEIKNDGGVVHLITFPVHPSTKLP